MKDYETVTLYYRNWHIFPNKGNWCVCRADWEVPEYLNMPGLSAAYDYIDKIEGEGEYEEETVNRKSFSVGYSGRVTYLS